MRLFARLVLVFALLASVPLSAETTVALSPIDIVPFGDPVDPVVTCGPTSCIVVWVSETVGDTSFVAHEVFFRTYRLDGTPFQPTATMIAGNSNYAPSAIWNGSEFLVTWTLPICDALPASCAGLGVARVSSQGLLLGEPRQVRPGSLSRPPAQPVMGSNGSSVLLYLEGALYLMNSDMEIVSSRPSERVLAITSDGDNFLVVVESADQLLVRFLGADAALLGEDDLGFGELAAASYNGQSFGIVWTDASEVRAAEVDFEGKVTSRVRLAISGGYAPAIAWRDEMWMAAWETPDAPGILCAAEFSGLFVNAGCYERPRTQTAATLTISDVGVVEAWVNALGFPARVNVEFLQPFEDPFLVAEGTASEIVRQYQLPSIARNAGGSAVAWTDGGVVYVGGLNDDGSPRPVVAMPGANTIAFQVAGAPDRTLVLWQLGFTDAYAAVLNTNNQFVVAPVRIGRILPAASFDGEGWRLAWFDDSQLRIRTMRIGLDGSTSATTLVAETGTFQFHPDVACESASSCVVVWDENPGAGPRRIQAARIGTGEAWVVGTGAVSSPSIAWNGDHYVVGWDSSTGGFFSSYRGARIDRDGNRFFPADESGFAIFEAYPPREIELVPWSNGRVLAYRPDDSEQAQNGVAIIASSGDGVQRLAPFGVREMDIATDDNGIFIAYEQDGRIFLRSLPVAQRTRAIRR